MPVIHLQTALTQFAGTVHLIGAELDHAMACAAAADGRAGAHGGAEVAASRPAALEAIEEHRRWLRQRLADAERDGGGRDPRIGAERFARKLRLTLDAESDAGEIMARAESDLDRGTGEITDTPARLAGPRPPPPRHP